MKSEKNEKYVFSNTVPMAERRRIWAILRRFDAVLYGKTTVCWENAREPMMPPAV